MNHENVNPFIGAVTENPNVCVLMLYAQKGSLQVRHVYCKHIETDNRYRHAC